MWEDEPDEENYVGEQAHGVHGEGGLVEDLGGDRREAGAKVVAVQAQDGEERDRHRDPVDGDGEHTVRARQAAPRHAQHGQSEYLAISRKIFSENSHVS